jgi:hypothetical protein
MNLKKGKQECDRATHHLDRIEERSIEVLEGVIDPNTCPPPSDN